MTELRVEGMTCGHCVSAVTRAVRSVDPRAEVQVDLARGSVTVSGQSEAGELVKAIGEAGYPATVADSKAAPSPRKAGCCCG